MRSVAQTSMVKPTNFMQLCTLSNARCRRRPTRRLRLQCGKCATSFLNHWKWRVGDKQVPLFQRLQCTSFWVSAHGSEVLPTVFAWQMNALTFFLAKALFCADHITDRFLKNSPCQRDNSEERFVTLKCL